MKKSDRQKVFNKYGGKCAYCGCVLPEKGWHLDHIEPIRRKYKTVIREKEKIGYDGKPFVTKEYVTVADGCDNPHLDCIDNALPACAKCNINKHSDSVEGFRSSIVQYLESLNRYSVQYQMSKKYGLVQETGNNVEFYFEKHEPN